MIYEFPDFERYSGEHIAAVRPDLERLANIVRCNLRVLEGLLGIRTDHPDLAREYDPLCAELCEAYARIEAQEHDLRTARAWIEHLEEKLAAAEDDDEDRLYRSVGLSPSAHVIVIAAARRALLQHYHPDRWPEDERASAKANFLTVSAAFDKLTKLYK